MFEEPEEITKDVLRGLIKRERRDRFKVKDKDEVKVLEGVFDVRTMLILYSLMNRGHLSSLKGVVRTGKEARVYWGVGSHGDVAVKIYYTVASQFKRRVAYMKGDPRFRNVKHTPYGIAEAWARREFINLRQAHGAGIPVPKPLSVKGNVLIMEFMGVDGVPAPLLVESEVDEDDYHMVLEHVKRLWDDASLVHADLSEYNIFKWKGRLILLDFGSAVDKDHPNALEFLARDINNVNRFFDERGIEIRRADEVLEEVIHS